MEYKYDLQEDWVDPPSWTVTPIKLFAVMLMIVGVAEIWSEKYSLFKVSISIVVGVLLFFVAARNFRPLIGTKTKYIDIDADKIKWRQGIMDTDKVISRTEITDTYIRNNKVFFKTNRGGVFSIWLNQFQNKEKLDEFLAFYEKELQAK